MKTNAWMQAGAEFVDYRKRLGYSEGDAGRHAIGLARYMERHAKGRPLTHELLRQWAESDGASPGERLAGVHAFVRWLRIYDLSLDISDAVFLGRGHHDSRQPPYIYLPTEVTAMMDAAAREQPGDPVPGICAWGLIGLLNAAGLRIGEALALDEDDVDWEVGLLRIRSSKNVPLRLVPLHASAVSALRRYRDERNRAMDRYRGQAFFAAGGKRLGYGAVRLHFQEVKRRAGVPLTQHHRNPRLHDFRHTFASRYLLRQYREGGDLVSAVANLSVYLGHAGVACTYWYLLAVPELMALCGNRFFRHVENRRRGGRP